MVVSSKLEPVAGGRRDDLHRLHRMATLRNPVCSTAAVNFRPAAAAPSSLGGTPAHQAVAPPSIEKSAPVTQDASSDVRYTTAQAMSSG